ncbi:MAG: PH domain-containing protein [Prochloraceae cyanobacterium]
MWGIFGWLLTQRRGFIEIYVSQLDRAIVIYRRNGKILLVSPSSPSLFVESLRNRLY